MSLYNASDEASAPATPSTGRKVLYPKSDGWYYTDSTGTEYQIADTTSLFRLNDIINGQFRIAQAGTSFAAPASGAYDLDGWRNSNNTSAVFTVAQATGSSTGKLCRTVTVTTALASVAAADYVLQQMRLEGYDCVKYLGNDFIIGFRVKSSVTGVHCVALYDATSSYVAEYTINTANTWEYKTVTITGGLQAVSSSTNGLGLQITFSNAVGSTYQTTAGSWNTGVFFATANQVNDMATVGNVFALEDVTLNLGTVATVDTATYDEDLRRCQRYFQTTSIPVSASTDSYFGLWFYKVSMRATPTITGGGAGFTVNASSSEDVLICYQTTRAIVLLTASSRL